MSNKQHTVFSSDWHIGHTNVLTFCPRPYKSLDEMHRNLIKNYNNNVHGDTIGYFLGDMGIAGTALVKSIMDELRGTKVLILGNHDKGVNAMYNAGFDVVLHSAELVIQTQKVSMSHCPLFGTYREDVSMMTNPRYHEDGSLENWHGETRDSNKHFICEDKGQFHLHGHIHSPNGGKSTKIQGRQFDVGVDANNYRPVQISAIESWIAKELNDVT